MSLHDPLSFPISAQKDGKGTVPQNFSRRCLVFLCSFPLYGMTVDAVGIRIPSK